MTVLKHPESTHQPASALSDEALRFACMMPPFIRGQLAFYARKKGSIGEKEVESIIAGDQVALGEYSKLCAAHEKTRLGTAVFNLVLQAYQPRVNREVFDPRVRYNLAKSTIQGDALIERVRELSRLHEPVPGVDEKRKRPKESGNKSVLDDAIRQNVIPTIALAEVLSEQGVASPFTLTFPEVYLRLIRRYSPRVFERLKKDHAEGVIDVGFSNAHHSLGPLLSRDDLSREYEHSLCYFLDNFRRPGNEYTLHIPEQAFTRKEDGHPDLLDILDELQRKHGVGLTIYLDSRSHNLPYPAEGFNISTATHLKYEGQSSGTKVVFRAYNASDNLAFHVTPKEDQLAKMPGTEGASGLNPQTERDWATAEGGRIFGEIVGNIFGVSNWRDPLYEGRNSMMSVELDAEWVGLHHPGVPLALETALKAMSEFGIEIASTEKSLAMVPVVSESQKRPRSASWSGGFDLWINWKTQWLRDIVGGTLTAYKKPMLRMTELLRQKFPDANEDDMPKELAACWEFYGLSLLSCPYWWSENDPGYPNAIPTINGLFHDMAGCGRAAGHMMRHMLSEPREYRLNADEVRELEVMQEGLNQSYQALLDNPQARRYPLLASTLDQYKKAQT